MGRIPDRLETDMDGSWARRWRPVPLPFGSVRTRRVRIVPGDHVWWGGRPSRTRPLTMRKTRIAAAVVSWVGLAAVGLGQAGCFSGGGLHAPHVTRIFAPRPVAVVDKYFDIASENRLSRTIVTQPRIGATLLEPWSLDSVSFTDRFESTLQTMRRFAIIKIEPAPSGGYLVKVEVRKELEDLVKPDRMAAGRAVFNNDFPVNRTREIVGPVPAPVGWIPRGRDPNLEQAILAGVRDALFL